MIKKSTKGYTLIESLVYLAIFTALSILVINSFLLALRSFSSTRTNRDLLESGATVLSRISREMRSATAIDLSNSTLGSHPGVLQLKGVDGSGVAQTVKFSVSGNAINMYKNGTLVDTLTSTNIKVDNLLFRRITTVKGEAVKIELMLEDTRSKTVRTEKFYDTVILRAEYN
jgi:Tfp pilus assembly protein PilW